MGKQWKQCQILFWGSKIIADGDYSHEIKRYLLLGREAMTNLDCLLKCRVILLTKVCLVKAMVYPVVMYGCESWSIKKADHRRIDAFKLWCWRTLESLLDSKEIKAVHPKGNQSWIFIGSWSWNSNTLDAEAETPILWPPDVKNWLIGIDTDAGKDWWQEEKRKIKYEMVGWHYQFNVHEFEQAPGVGDVQGSLVCCTPWHHKESDTTEWLNWTESYILPRASQTLSTSYL